MQVRNWMSEQLEVVHPDDNVATVRARFLKRRVRQFPVVADGTLVGIVTDRDVRAARDGATKVAAIMTASPITATPSTPVEDAAALLRAHKIGALPVIEHGVLVGIVSESDLLQALVELAQVLEPTTLLELECEDGMRGAQRVRALLERHGGRIPWMSAAADPSGRMRVAVRVRMPVGHAPEQVLEEAGFRVLSCLTGRAAASGAREATADADAYTI